MFERLTGFTLFAAILLSPSTSFAQARYDRSNTERLRVDTIGRVLEVSGRRNVACPAQTPKTAVFLIIGQSNSANFAESKFRTARPTRVVNFAESSCYSAASPLLGTNGFGGESWTLLGDNLINAGAFDRVILVTSGIGGTEIARWKAGGDLNLLLEDVVGRVQDKYTITRVLWHQGESDLFAKTTTEDYIAGFESLVATLRQAKVFAPIYVSVASKCGRVGHSAEDWSKDDAVTAAQKRIVNTDRGIFAGPNTNTLIPISDRYDACHFGTSGQVKFANDWLRVLSGK